MFLEEDADTHAVISLQSSSTKNLIVQDGVDKILATAAQIGVLCDAGNWRAGFSMASAPGTISHTGSTQQVTLETFGNTLKTQGSSPTASLESVWRFEGGFRFHATRDLEGIVTDIYMSDGQQIPLVGLQWEKDKAIWMASFSSYERGAMTVTSVQTGYIRKHKSFDWGLGPYYRDHATSRSGDVSTRAYGILYSSEIRFQ